MSVVIIKESSYEYSRLRSDVFDILRELDSGVIKKDSRVLIKPNLLRASREKDAIVTHPLIIKAVSEYVISRGGNPQVSDSPPMGSFSNIIKTCGISNALHGMPVAIKEFKTSKKVAVEGRIKAVELAEDSLRADVIINLPKLKTHAQMVLTLAVKNLFGCVIGMKKPEWHFRVGKDRGLFGELLVSIYKTLMPSINLIDGILAMEGDGPGRSGTPRHLGILIGSDDALSADLAVSKIIGIDPFSVPTNKKAKQMGLIKDFELIGNVKLIKDFLLPKTADILFGPRFAHKFLRHHLTSRPIGIRDLCKSCNDCLKICPASAIKLSPHKKGIEFDYTKCIRCYCCMEICSHRAIKIEEPLLRRTLKKVSRKA